MAELVQHIARKQVKLGSIPELHVQVECATYSHSPTGFVPRAWSMSSQLRLEYRCLTLFLNWPCTCMSEKKFIVGHCARCLISVLLHISVLCLNHITCWSRYLRQSLFGGEGSRGTLPPPSHWLCIHMQVLLNCNGFICYDWLLVCTCLPSNKTLKKNSVCYICDTQMSWLA